MIVRAIDPNATGIVDGHRAARPNDRADVTTILRDRNGEHATLVDRKMIAIGEGERRRNAFAGADMQRVIVDMIPLASV
jgi:hypothetical protein